MCFEMRSSTLTEAAWEPLPDILIGGSLHAHPIRGKGGKEIRWHKLRFWPDSHIFFGRSHDVRAPGTLGEAANGGRAPVDGKQAHRRMILRTLRQLR